MKTVESGDSLRNDYECRVSLCADKLGQSCDEHTSTISSQAFTIVVMRFGRERDWFHVHAIVNDYNSANAPITVHYSKLEGSRVPFSISHDNIVSIGLHHLKLNRACTAWETW